jgi:hypothetical protein
MIRRVFDKNFLSSEINLKQANGNRKPMIGGFTELIEE